MSTIRGAAARQAAASVAQRAARHPQDHTGHQHSGGLRHHTAHQVRYRHWCCERKVRLLVVMDFKDQKLRKSLYSNKLITKKKNSATLPC